MEAYEGLLLDEKSALFRELQFRKARRSQPQSPIAVPSSSSMTTSTAVASTRSLSSGEEEGEENVEKKKEEEKEGYQKSNVHSQGMLFDIESEEEEEEEEEGGKGMKKMPLPKMDPGRDVRERMLFVINFIIIST